MVANTLSKDFNVDYRMGPIKSHECLITLNNVRSFYWTFPTIEAGGESNGQVLVVREANLGSPQNYHPN